MARRAIVLLVFLAAVGLIVAGASSGSGAAQKKWKIALQMSVFINPWQTVSKNQVYAEANTPPYAGRVKVDTYISGTSVEKEIQQIQQIVAKGYDALVIFPISPTALNAAVSLACSRGMPVVSFDSEIRNNCVYNVHINQRAAGVLTAQWLAKKMKYQGNLVMSTGVPGTSVDTDRKGGALSVFKKYPKIKIVATVNGQWDNAVSQQTMAGVLASHPEKIDGVWGEVGWGNLRAFQVAKRPVPPMVGESENAFRNAVFDEQVDGVSYGSPPYTGAYALKMAIALLEGNKNLPKDMIVPLPLNDRATLKRCFDVQKGCNVFPLSKIPGNWFVDFHDETLVPELCFQSALKAKPCPGARAKPPVAKSFPASATSRA